MRRSCESRGLAVQHRQGDDFHYSEIGGFRKGGLSYRVLMRIVASGDDNSYLLMEYGPGRVERPRARRVNLDKVGAILDDLRVPCAVNGMAAGEFASDRFKPIINLPFLQFNTSLVYFDEIRGVTLARTTEGIESSVDINISDEDEIQVVAQTDYSAITSSGLPAESLARLTKLRLQAVTEIQPDSEK